MCLTDSIKWNELMDVPMAFLHPLPVVNSSLVLSFTMLLPDFSLEVFFLAYCLSTSALSAPVAENGVGDSSWSHEKQDRRAAIPIGFQLNMSVLSETNLLSPCWSLFPSYCEQTFGRERRTDGSQHIVLFIFSQFAFWSKLVFSSFSLGQESTCLYKSVRIF